jgi:YidC/Oxa1 family membrane protein insertase
MFLWLGLVLALWINYETWQRDYATPPSPTSVAAAPTGGGQLAATVPQANPPVAAPDTMAATPAAPVASTPAPAALTDEAANALPPATLGFVRITTDVLDLDVSLRGGDLIRADLLRYPLVKGADERVRLLNSASQHFYFIQTGLTDADGSAQPTHLAAFTAPQTRFALSEGADELRVPLTWVDAQGVVTLIVSISNIKSKTAAKHRGAPPRTPRSCGTTSRSSARCSASRAMPSRVRRITTAPNISRSIVGTLPRANCRAR